MEASLVTLEEHVTCSAIDPTSRLLATSSSAAVSTFAQADDCSWARTGVWLAPSPVQSLAWAPPAFGALLAVAHVGGVSLLRLCAGGLAQVAALGGGWEATALAFAPLEHGLLLAVACSDGAVRLHGEAEGLWAERSSLELSSHVPATALAWAPAGADRPPTLAVGTASGAGVWQYQAALRRWARLVALEVSPNVLRFSPAAGRPHLLLAAAEQASVLLWKLDMPAAGLAAASLQHTWSLEAPVGSLGFDFLGTSLAAAAGGTIHRWTANLFGTWEALQ